MMRPTRRTLLLLLVPPLIAAAAFPASVQDALRSITADQIRAHLVFLADDVLEGRAPGTRGEAVTVRYIASQLERSGVQPLRGGWFQTVPLVGWRPDPRRIAAEVTVGTRRATLRYPSGYVLWTEGGADSASATAELVFAGYGVRAREHSWDDFKGRDVRGKVLVVLIGDPPAPPGQPRIFDGPALSYYGRWTYKVEEAARLGAAAVLLVHTAAGAGYPWRVVETSWTGEQVALVPPEAATSPQINGWVTQDVARAMFALADLDYTELFVRAARRDFQPVFTGIQVSLRAGGRARRFNGTNVAGIVHGRHATRRSEVVIMTAHHDHLGIGPALDGDSIYNGAYDNASGVAALLEVAEAFASMTTPPERSVLFLFTTAEEAGLLGSTHYVRNPLVPLQRTVAALNIDGANLWGETDDVGGIGLERSTLGTTLEAQATSLGLHVSGERAPDKGFFFRSDHFPFARAGIPALGIDHGTSFRNRPNGWGQALLSRYESERYHLPSDSIDATFEFSGAVQQARVAFLVAHDVANTATPPRWHRGGEVTVPDTQQHRGGPQR